MRLHRFYVDPEKVELRHDFWLTDPGLYNQWTRVLRYRTGSQLVLFDGAQSERLYKIEEISKDSVKLSLVTDFERKLPRRHVYLFFSLLKKDKNDWIIQKCTELGVRNFVPVLADRSEKTGFNIERAEKIAIEASEQCGRGDIPRFREPVGLNNVIAEYGDRLKLFIADEQFNNSPDIAQISEDVPIGVLIGPEGGWSESEMEFIEASSVNKLNLGDFTLRAETAAVVAVAKLI